MTTAKIFENGRSQAVRLPKEYRFKDEELAWTISVDNVFCGDPLGQAEKKEAEE